LGERISHLIRMPTIAVPMILVLPYLSLARPHQPVVRAARTPWVIVMAAEDYDSQDDSLERWTVRERN
jgi:hypothetical protein